MSSNYNDFRFNFIGIEELLNYPSNKGMALLLRHAERQPIENDDDVINADLVENGVAQSLNFGHHIQQNWIIDNVFTSPIPRCINTGKSILRGMKREPVVQVRWWLFSPFWQIFDPETPSPPDGTINLHYEHMSWIMNKQKISTVLDRIQIPETPGHVNLYIAHDTTIVPVLGYLKQLEKIHMKNLPDFLTGIALEENHYRTKQLANLN